MMSSSGSHRLRHSSTASAFSQAVIVVERRCSTCERSCTSARLFHRATVRLQTPNWRARLASEPELCPRDSAIARTNRDG